MSKPESSAVNPYNVFFGQQGWICPKCGRVYSPFTQMCLYCKGETTIISNSCDRSNISVNEHYGDDYFENEVKRVLTWLSNKPLALRLTETEKEMVREEYAKTYPNDIDRGVTSICVAAVLERIFGSDFFKEGE